MHLLAVGCILFIDQILASRNEIIETILFLQQVASVMPLLTVLATATNVGHHENAIHIVQKQQTNNGKIWRQRNVETTVTIQQTRIVTILLDVL